jgi:hypothetical protein
MWGDPMNARVNRQLLATTKFDSSALGMLTFAVHQFAAPGRYHATVRHGGRAVAEVPFLVDEKSDQMQLDIDLALAERAANERPRGCECKDEKHSSHVISPKGFVLFHVSSGDGYSVVVSSETDKTPSFDSTKLGRGDLFALSLLEPATYSLANTANGSTAEIRVALPEAAKRLGELETQQIDVSEKRFARDRIEAMSTQGLVFRLAAPARIVIEKKESTGEEGKRTTPFIRRTLPRLSRPTEKH